MAALRSVIIALMILGAGIFVIQRLGEGFLKSPGLPTEVNMFGDIITGARSLTDLILMGIGAIVVLLLIVWIIRKIQARHAARPPAMPTPPKLLELPEEIPEEETAELPAEEEEREEAPEEEK